MATKREREKLLALFKESEEVRANENAGQFYAGYNHGLDIALEIIGVSFQERWNIWDAARHSTLQETT